MMGGSSLTLPPPMTAKFAILRVQKLKSPVAVRRSMQHAFREQDTPNADPRRTPDNTRHFARNVEEGMAAFADRLPAKHRKDAVQCVEYLVTASPEAMAGKSREEQDAYLKDALRWIQDRHGINNVVCAGIHRDETTPHLYAYVVPVDPDSGRLNAKRWFGGAKALSEMQSEFADKIGHKHGLERGIEGSRATHQRVQRFYGAIEHPPQDVTIDASALTPQVTKSGLLRDTVETPAQVAERLTKGVREIYAPAMAAASVAHQEREKAKEAQRTVEHLQRYVKPFIDMIRPLNDAMREKAMDVMAAVREKLLGEQMRESIDRQQQRQQVAERPRNQGPDLSR